MGHATMGHEGDIVAGLDDLAWSQTMAVLLDDLLREGLGCLWDLAADILRRLPL